MQAQKRKRLLVSTEASLVTADKNMGPDDAGRASKLHYASGWFRLLQTILKPTGLVPDLFRLIVAYIDRRRIFLVVKTVDPSRSDREHHYLASFHPQDDCQRLYLHKALDDSVILPSLVRIHDWLWASNQYSGDLTPVFQLGPNVKQLKAVLDNAGRKFARLQLVEINGEIYGINLDNNRARDHKTMARWHLTSDVRGTNLLAWVKKKPLQLPVTLPSNTGCIVQVENRYVMMVFIHVDERWLGFVRYDTQLDEWNITTLDLDGSKHGAFQSVLPGDESDLSIQAIVANQDREVILWLTWWSDSDGTHHEQRASTTIRIIRVHLERLTWRHQCKNPQRMCEDDDKINQQEHSDTCAVTTLIQPNSRLDPGGLVTLAALDHYLYVIQNQTQEDKSRLEGNHNRENHNVENDKTEIGYVFEYDLKRQHWTNDNPALNTIMTRGPVDRRTVLKTSLTKRWAETQTYIQSLSVASTTSIVLSLNSHV